MLFQGCSSPSGPNVVGKYSRTPRVPASKLGPAYSYTNTTELKADGSYTQSTDRGGFKVLQRGTYEVDGDNITFRPGLSDKNRTPYTKKIKGNVLDPGIFQRVRR